MQLRKFLEGMPQQLDAYFTSLLQKSLDGQSLTAEQQQSVDRMLVKLHDMMKDYLNWDSMETMYQDIYGKTFTQSEVDGMISFYSSPAGHAVVVKLPLVMQNTLAATQQRMQALLPKIQQMAKDTAAQIKASPAPAPKAKTG